MASMLLGAVLRERYDRINERITSLDITVFIAGLVLYFVGKKLLGNSMISANFSVYCR